MAPPNPNPPSPYTVPSPTPGADVPVPGLIPYKRTTEYGSQTIRTVPSEEGKASKTALDEAYKAKVGALKTQQNAEIEIEGLQEKHAQDLADAASAAELERTALTERRATERAALDAQEAKKRVEMERVSKPTTYWEDKSTPARILAGILIGAGESVTGGTGQSAAYKIFENAAAEDRQHKLDILTAATTGHKLAREDIATAKARFDEGIIDLNNRTIARNNTLVKQMEALKAKVPQATLKFNETIAQANLDSAKSMQEIANRHEVKVEGAHTSTERVEGEKPGTTTKLPTDLDVFDLGGKPYGKARSEVEARGIRGANAAATGLLNSINALKTHVKKEGRTVPGTEAAAEREAMVSDATSYLTTLFNTGVLNAGENERYKGLLSTGLLKGGESTAKGLDTMEVGIKNRYETKLKAEATKSTPAAPIAAPITPPSEERANAMQEAKTLTERLRTKKDHRKAEEIRATLRDLAAKYGTPLPSE